MELITSAAGVILERAALATGFAAAAIATAIVLVLNAVDASGGVAGVIFVLGVAAAGLIGGEVARRTEPPG